MSPHHHPFAPCIGAPCSSVLLPYCQTSASPHFGVSPRAGCWIIWSSGLPQWRTMGGFKGSVGAWGHCLPRSWRPGKSRHNAASSHTTPILCKADPSWKRTYFAPGVNSRKMVKFSQGRRRAGARGTWETGNWGQSDKPWILPDKERPANLFRFLFADAIWHGLNNDGIITE